MRSLGNGWFTDKKRQQKINKLGILLVLGFLVLGAIALALNAADLQVLNTEGWVGDRERELLFIVVLLGLLVIIPVFVLTFVIAWRYREGNSKAKYTPDHDGNPLLELTWWGIPLAIILVLSIITWQSTHQLDPNKQLVSNTKTMTIQVVALPWRWLFIYPEQQVASLNYVNFPAKTPIEFEITSDAPMNSFWIPKLGGQIYAMSGMSTHLNLIADTTGTFRGSSANISGRGFSGMDFEAKTMPEQDFGRWVTTAKQSGEDLDIDKYLEISKPSTSNETVAYGKYASHLYDKVVMKYMMPGFDMHKEYND